MSQRSFDSGLRSMPRFAAAGALALSALSGCALLGKSDPPVRRYFTLDPLEQVSPASAPQAPAKIAADGRRLRLGHVTGSSHLRERMVVRTAGLELTFSETRRWTERPDVYLHRALAHALFEQRLNGRGQLAAHVIGHSLLQRGARVGLDQFLQLWTDRGTAAAARTVYGCQMQVTILVVGREQLHVHLDRNVDIPSRVGGVYH